MSRVLGFCPMGCGQSLYALSSDGQIVCSDPACPDMQAVHKILDTRETEHLVKLTETGFSIVHPLKERVDGALLDCDLVGELSEWENPAFPPGKYRVIARSDVNDWEPLGAENANVS